MNKEVKRMEEKKQVKHGVSVNLNLETTPILYTDNIFMTTNADGVVLDIGQKVGSTHQIRIVARIGMSRDHAKKFLREFSRLLAMTEGKIQTGTKKN